MKQLLGLGIASLLFTGCGARPSSELQIISSGGTVFSRV